MTSDWNSDGINTIGLFYNGIFYLRNANTTGSADLTIAFGLPTNLPFAGNWDGLPSTPPPTPGSAPLKTD